MRGSQLSRKPHQKPAPKPYPRTAAFKAALAYAGITQKAWCEARDITEPHLYRVLRGQRDSATLIADVDAFIAEHTPARVA